MPKLNLDANSEATQVIERVVSRMLAQAGINDAYVVDWGLEAFPEGMVLNAGVHLRVLQSEFQALVEEELGK